MDIRKPSLLHQRGGLIRDSKSLAHHVSRFDECPAPLGHGVVFTHSAIVTREELFQLDSTHLYLSQNSLDHQLRRLYHRRECWTVLYLTC